MMPDDASDIVFSALADPTRRRLPSAIAAHPATATELAGELPISRQAVVKHLSMLAHAGLLERERDGRDVRYRVTPGAAVRCRHLDRQGRRGVGCAAGGAALERAQLTRRSAGSGGPIASGGPYPGCAPTRAPSDAARRMTWADRGAPRPAPRGWLRAATGRSRRCA